MNANGVDPIRKQQEIPELPGDPGNEQLLIGGILNAPDPNATFTQVLEIVGDESAFCLDKHRFTFSSMRAVAARGERIEVSALHTELSSRDQILYVGGLTGLMEFADCPALIGVESYARRVREDADRRRLWVFLNDKMNRICARDPVAEIADEATEFLEDMRYRETGGIDIFDQIPSVHEFAATNQVEYVVEGLVPMSAITAIVGAPGNGKSTFCTALGGRVALGWTFLGRATSQRKMLLLDVENPLPTITERLERLGIQDGTEFRVIGGWNDRALDPRKRKNLTRILNWVVRTHPKPLIIIDGFRGFLKGDENASDIVRAFMDELRKLADAGAGVILLHHSGKGDSSKKFRGSSDFEAALDAAYTLTNLGERGLGKLALKTFKSRMLADNGELVLRYRDGEFRIDSEPHAVARTLAEQLTDLLRNNAGTSTTEFEKKAAAAGLGRNQARSFLEDGVLSGDIRQTRGRKTPNTTGSSSKRRRFSEARHFSSSTQLATPTPIRVCGEVAYCADMLKRQSP